MGPDPNYHGRSKTRRHYKGRRFCTAIELIVGATALLRHVRKDRHRPIPWLASLLERKPPKLVAVALANKFARAVTPNIGQQGPECRL
jgi:transposase